MEKMITGLDWDHVKNHMMVLGMQALLDYCDSNFTPEETISYEDWDSLPVPTENIDKDYKNNVHPVPKLQNIPRLEEIERSYGLQCTNIIVYPPNTCMHWHTNNDMPGERIYITLSEGGSVFKSLKEDGTFDYEYDDKGMHIRQFFVDPEKPHWHTIYAKNTRVVFGFKKSTNVSSNKYAPLPHGLPGALDGHPPV